MKSKQNGQKLVFEEGDVFTAQKYLRNLASGRSPLDGADLAEDHLLREPAMVNALNLAADLLEAWLDNGGFNRVEPKRTRPFAISDADRAKIVISKEPVGIMTIAKRIAQVLPYDMQTVRYAQISNGKGNPGRNAGSRPRRDSRSASGPWTAGASTGAVTGKTSMTRMRSG